MNKLDTLYYKVIGKHYLDFSDKSDAELISLFKPITNFVVTKSNNDGSVFDIRLKDDVTFDILKEQIGISEDTFVELVNEIIKRKLTTSQLYA